MVVGYKLFLTHYHGDSGGTETEHQVGLVWREPKTDDSEVIPRVGDTVDFKGHEYKITKVVHRVRGFDEEVSFAQAINVYGDDRGDEVLIPRIDARTKGGG